MLRRREFLTRVAAVPAAIIGSTLASKSIAGDIPRTVRVHCEEVVPHLGWTPQPETVIIKRHVSWTCINEEFLPEVGEILQITQGSEQFRVRVILHEELWRGERRNKS